MPEFENLEPYVDPSSNRIMPVAPHSGAAHDYVLRQREGGRSAAERRRSTIPQLPSSEGATQISTEEMERAYRDAVKASRARGGGSIEKDALVMSCGKTMFCVG